MAMLTCPKCGQVQVNEIGKPCIKCREILGTQAGSNRRKEERQILENPASKEQHPDEERLKCPKCGAVQPVRTAKFCLECGAKVELPPPKVDPISKPVERTKTESIIGWAAIIVIAVAFCVYFVSDRYEDYKFEREWESRSQTYSSHISPEENQQLVNSTPIVSKSDIAGIWNGGKINDGNHTQYLYFSSDGVYWMAKKSGAPSASEFTGNSDYRVASSYSISVNSVGDTICDFGSWTATIYSSNSMSVSGRTISGSYVYANSGGSQTYSSSGSTYSNATTGERNALEKAKSYLSTMPFSYSGLVEQLEYMGINIPLVALVKI